MKQTNKTLDMLQVQAKCSSANIELLSAGREFLVQTLCLMKMKHAQLKEEHDKTKMEKGSLQIENQTLSQKISYMKQVSATSNPNAF